MVAKSTFSSLALPCVSKRWTLLLGVSLFATVVSVINYTQLQSFRPFLPFFNTYRVNNFSISHDSGFVGALKDDIFPDCFQSPFVACSPLSDLMTWKPERLVLKSETQGTVTYYDVRTNVTVRPMVVTSLVEFGDSFKNFQTFNFDVCPLPCEFRPRERIHQARGVIVDGRWVRNEHFPKTRRPDQIYVLTVLESPFHYAGTLLKSRSLFKDEINLAMTYRLDSNIRFFYSGLCLNDAPKKSREELRGMFQKKTRAVAWFVSNCHTPSRRMKYVMELKKYIDVDIYGRCGNRSFQDFGSEQNFLTSTYKFYLSFENSFCQDYVSEKFFKLFSQGVYVVPVVRGAINYEKYFPPFTFINTARFKTPMELATHLRDVGGDFEKYSKYLEARDTYVAQPYGYQFTKRMCDVCTALHEDDPQVRARYSDIGRWLERDMCYIPN